MKKEALTKTVTVFKNLIWAYIYTYIILTIRARHFGYLDIFLSHRDE
jgi:hypothetical protein